MSDALDKIIDAVFSTADTGEVRYIISSTPIGPVMFGSDGSMRYGDNFEDDVPAEFREEARRFLAEQFKKKP